MLFSEESWKSVLPLRCNSKKIKITGKLHNLPQCTGNWMHAVRQLPFVWTQSCQQQPIAFSLL
jgi:hypothetical protein